MKDIDYSSDLAAIMRLNKKATIETMSINLTPSNPTTGYKYYQWLYRHYGVKPKEELISKMEDKKWTKNLKRCYWVLEL